MQSRSMGFKLLLIGVLALIMTIPALFVYGIISDRESRARQALNEVVALTGGQQTVLGPVLLVPSTNSTVAPIVIFPVTGNAMVETKAEQRHRSLFRVPVYQSKINFNAKFEISNQTKTALGPYLDWDKAQIAIGVTDVRGGSSEPVLNMMGKTFSFVPSSLNADIAKTASSISLLSAALDAPIDLTAPLEIQVSLQLNGAQRIAIPAFAKSTSIEIRGDWPNPSFDGSFLPIKRSINGHGFSAQWYIPFIARGIGATADFNTLATLNSAPAGVTFVDVRNPYQAVTRSVKYALLFLALIFLAYFFLEVSTGKRVHPAQYTLVGIAQVIFYLLLLSISERIGFNAGFALAAIATIALISWYAGSVFGRRKYAMRAAAVFIAIYVIIYSLLTLEDESLLLGSIISFLAIATIMYMTRNIDWYSSMSSGLPESAQNSQRQPDQP